MSKNNRILYPVPRDPQVIHSHKPLPMAASVVDATPRQMNLGAILARRWKWIVFSTLVSLAAATYMTLNFSKSTWTYSSTLLFKRLPMGSSEYSPPTLSTMAEIVRTPQTVRTLQHEFALDISREGLTASIDAQVPPNSDALVISLTWDHPAKAERMLTYLVELFLEQVSEMRRSTLESIMTDARVNVASSSDRLALAKQALLEFTQEHNVLDVEDDLARLLVQIGDIEMVLETARLTKSNHEVQLDKLLTVQDEAEKNAAADTQELAGEVASAEEANPAVQDDLVALGPPAAGKSPNAPASRRLRASVDLQRRSFLQERIQEEQQRIAAKAQLELAEQEYQRAKALHSKRYISDAEFQRAEAEYNMLMAMEGSESVLRWKNQLERINSRMPNILYDNLQFGQMSPDMMAQTVARLELDLLAGEGQIRHLEEFLKNKQSELQRLVTLRKRSQELTERVQVALNERQQAEARLASLRNSLEAESDYFSIVEPPGPALYPVRSNARRWFVLSFGGIGLLLVGPVLLKEALSHRERPAESAARRLGLPVLARSETSTLSKHAYFPLESGRDDDCPRMLALRIQQFLEKPGSVMLFSSLNHRPPSIGLIARVAHCFVQRGERVILVDIGKTLEGRIGFSELVNEEALEAARKRVVENNRAGMPRFLLRSKHRVEEQPLGVSDYIGGIESDAEHLILSSCIAGVDCLLAGSIPLPPEGVASRRMTDLLDQLRQKYSRVIVLGPTTAHPVDLEMLAARVDGIIFSTVGPRTENMQGEEVVSNLIDLDAPILGFVA